MGHRSSVSKSLARTEIRKSGVAAPYAAAEPGLGAILPQPRSGPRMVGLGWVGLGGFGWGLVGWVGGFGWVLSLPHLLEQVRHIPKWAACL